MLAAKIAAPVRQGQLPPRPSDEGEKRRPSTDGTDTLICFVDKWTTWNLVAFFFSYPVCVYLVQKLQGIRLGRSPSESQGSGDGEKIACRRAACKTPSVQPLSDLRRVDVQEIRRLLLAQLTRGAFGSHWPRLICGLGMHRLLGHPSAAAAGLATELRSLVPL